MYSRLLLCCLLFPCCQAWAQQTDTLVKKLDSLQKVEAKPGNKPVNDVDKEDYTSQTNITPKVYVVLLATDLVQEVTGPFHASKKTWRKVGEFALLEGGLFFADRTIQHNTTMFMDNNPNLRKASQDITNFGGAWEGYTLAAFGAYGLIFNSNKVKTTTLLATQSYIVAGLMEGLLKGLIGRQRPNAYYPPGVQPENNIFRGPSVDGINSSFPSGHSTAVFSAATVFAQEYKDQTLIPVVAYTAASMVALSRITQNAHWATDVVAGAALGYVTGKQVVNNYHRYARLKAGKKKTAMLFNLQYYSGVVMPGFVYKF